MKRRVLIALGLLLMCICCTGLEAKAVSVKGKKATIYLKPGQRKKLTIKGSAKLPKWKSKNRNVVISPERGYIQAVAAGKTKMTAKYKKKTIKCTVVVMEMNTRLMSLKVGTSSKLKVRYGGKKVKWTSSDDSIVKVTNGTVKAKKSGVATIKATAHGRKFKCKIYVPKVTINATSLVASPPPEYGIVASKSTAKLKVKNNCSVPYFASENPAVATIDAAGNITAVAKGSAVVSVSMDGLVYKTTISVSDRPVDIYLNYVNKYSKYVKNHGKYFKRADTPTATYQEAKSLVSQSKTAKVNCRAHCTWAFYDMGIATNGIWAKEGSFAGKFKGKMPLYLTRMTVGGPIGKTFKEAVDLGQLRPGDLCAFEDQTHTFTYSGVGYKFFDGGTVVEKAGYAKVGLLMDYSSVKYYNSKIISEVLRWNY